MTPKDMHVNKAPAATIYGEAISHSKEAKAISLRRAVMSTCHTFANNIVCQKHSPKRQLLFSSGCSNGEGDG